MVNFGDVIFEWSHLIVLNIFLVLSANLGQLGFFNSKAFIPIGLCTDETQWPPPPSKKVLRNLRMAPKHSYLHGKLSLLTLISLNKWTF